MRRGALWQRWRRCSLRCSDGSKRLGWRRVTRGMKNAAGCRGGGSTSVGRFRRRGAKGRRHEAVYGYWELSADGARNRRLRYACRVLLAQRWAIGLAEDTVAGLAHWEGVMVRAGVGLERSVGRVVGDEEGSGSEDYCSGGAVGRRDCTAPRDRVAGRGGATWSCRPSW